ncbi:MAG: hypothetical protein ACFFEF_16965 [Candidatus Thorarchaeota archaeon]
MSEMSLLQDLKSWLWIGKYWIPIYGLLLLFGIVVGTALEPFMYWWVFLLGVPLLVIPVTYRNLVGGGCNLKYQICALVKGAMAGLVLLTLTILMDAYVWSFLQSIVGWNPVNLGGVSLAFYQIWFYSGLIGGFGARIVEVKSMKQVNIAIAGFEEQ